MLSVDTAHRCFEQPQWQNLLKSPEKSPRAHFLIGKSHFGQSGIGKTPSAKEFPAEQPSVVALQVLGSNGRK